MSDDGSLRRHAKELQTNIYEFLGIETTAGESAIRKARGKLALKYHPDKAGADDVVAREKFELLEIAYGILSDPAIRQIYDNERLRRENAQKQRASNDAQRNAMIDDLLRREAAATVAVSENRAREERERELQAKGARRRKEKEEQLRKEAEERYERELRELQGDQMVQEATTGNEQASPNDDMEDRMIRIRFPADADIDRLDLQQRFSQFGEIENVLLPEIKRKKKRQKTENESRTAMIEFQSIASASAAVNEFPSIQKTDISGLLSQFSEVSWVKAPSKPIAENEIGTRSGVDQKAKPAHNRKIAPRFSSYKRPPRPSAPSENHRDREAERRQVIEEMEKAEKES